MRGLFCIVSMEFLTFEYSTRRPLSTGKFSAFLVDYFSCFTILEEDSFSFMLVTKCVTMRNLLE